MPVDAMSAAAHPRASGFSYDATVLACDGVSIPSIVEAVGTPTYIYSAALIRDTYGRIDAAFASHPHSIHYALKANSTLGIARLLQGLGSGADANSGGEIEVALRAGFSPDQIVFTGVGKSRRELERAIGLDVKAINVESAGEAERVAELATAIGRRARVAVRVNPDIDVRGHPHVSTGLRTSKFGVAWGDAPALCRAIADRRATELVGLHVHVGSQVLSLEPLARAADALADLAGELAAGGFILRHLDLGGGLGISYDGASAPSYADYAAALMPAGRRTGLTLLLEPGRVLVGPAGILVTSVIDVKPQGEGRYFVIVDGGMTDLMRPALYGAFHRIDLVRRRDADPPVTCDIVGPVCESSDVLGRDRPLALPREGELVAILDVGAYGSVMASNYNRRTTPAEVLVDEAGWRVIRRRQTIDDVLACEF